MYSLQEGDRPALKDALPGAGGLPWLPGLSRPRFLPALLDQGVGIRGEPHSTSPWSPSLLFWTAMWPQGWSTGLTVKSWSFRATRCHWLAVWPWAQSPTLGLSFLICQHEELVPDAFSNQSLSVLTFGGTVKRGRIRASPPPPHVSNTDYWGTAALHPPGVPAAWHGRSAGWKAGEGQYLQEAY